jgi:glycosyltransferase involved in cell wall biosynthesis
MESVTIVVMPRDKFSTMETCLEHIFKNTPEPFELWVLSGGTPEATKRKWEERYAGKAQFTFFPEFKNGADLRNFALGKIMTRLAVFVDSDVYVRPGWLEPLVRCQRETGAALVSPLILDRNDLIHTAGNDFFIMKKNGEAYATMELRYQHHKVAGPTNLVRRETAFGEMHCQLVLAEIGKKFEIFDANLREFQEMDAGLTLSKHDYKMMFEPESVVYLFYEQRLAHAEDIRFHMWKWNMTAMHEGFAYFKKKWRLDINPENSFDRYLRAVNSRVGFFSQHWPSRLSAWLDTVGYRLGKWGWAGP